MIKIKVPCRMKWCYNPTRKEDGSCDKWCMYNTKEIPSPGDEIRAMNDEQLAYFLQHELRPCPPPYYDNHFEGCLLDDTPEELVTETECDQCWILWLRDRKIREITNE